jgi:hypothetical protein
MNTERRIGRAYRTSFILDGDELPSCQKGAVKTRVQGNRAERCDISVISVMLLYHMLQGREASCTDLDVHNLKTR